MSRIVLVLYSATLFLFPWGWFPHFPFIPKPAQWSDAVFAATVVAWVLERWQARKWPDLNGRHIAIACYFLAASLSFLVATSNKQDGAWKLLGIWELCMLAVITSDLASRPGALRVIGHVIAVTSILTAVAALAGIVMFYAGVPTLLIGTYGDLTPSRWYARAEAGMFHPNLLASFCIFGMTVVGREESKLPAWLRRAAQTALWVAVILTFSRCILSVGLVVLIRNARTKMRRVIAASYATACVAVIVVLTVWNLSFDPSRPSTAHFSHEPSARWQSITSSLQTLKARPFFGSGLRVPPGRKGGMPFDAHLTPLNIAATMGLPALAAFVSLLIILWRRRTRPTDLALWGGLAGMGLDGLGQDVEDFRHLWVLIGLAAAKPEASANISFPEQYVSSQN